MKVTKIEGKKEFSVNVDVDDILNKIECLRSGFEENVFVRYGTSPEFGEKDFSYISKDEYLHNITIFKNEFLAKMTTNYLENIIENWARKKNGSFNRRNIKEVLSCNNCVVIHEWHNTWIYYIVKVVTVDDYNLRVGLYEKVDTPG